MSESSPHPLSQMLVIVPVFDEAPLIVCKLVNLAASPIRTTLRDKTAQLNEALRTASR